MDVCITKTIIENHENLDPFPILIAGTEFIDLDLDELKAFDSLIIESANQTSSVNVEIRFLRFGRDYLADVTIEDTGDHIEREVCFYEFEDDYLHVLTTFQEGIPYPYHTMRILVNPMFALAEGVFAL